MRAFCILKALEELGDKHGCGQRDPGTQQSGTAPLLITAAGSGEGLRLAMTMRATVFKSGGNKLDTDTGDQAKRQESHPGSKKETAECFVRVPGILSNNYNSAGQHFYSKLKTHSTSQSTSGRPVLSPAVRRGQEENWVNLGALTFPLIKQMGAEGTPVKSKSLFGHISHNHVGKMDPVATNGSKQPRKAVPGGGLAVAGVPSPEHGPDGKRRNAVKAMGHAATQTGCIRQILLLQLELIEQQQQQLQNKNKEIDDLKAEKEMLAARIERMERRLQMVRKDGVETRPTSTPRRRDSLESVPSEDPGQPEDQSHTPRHPTSERTGRNLKRRFLFQESRMSRSRRGHPKASPSKEGQALEEESREELEPEESPPGSTLVESEELPYMATTEMYLCCWHQPPPSPWRDQSPVQDDTVSVPSWQESIVDPLEEKKAIDLIESLDDAVFLKRHSKLELDEKRRKRWDIQRIREQRMFQRLQQRMNRQKVIQESEPELLSFYPEPDDVESVMITPFLPVVAFGRPLPNLKQQNFEIPWLDERSRSRQEVSKKKTPHRTCRK
ncbi:male-specific lethal 1-like 1 isoform 2-T2 [Clarias gariepinus]|uniref:male-specific lethal 1-like 1 isoform X2 n=1 Tax=Clarias gariepinus TaxID=13013 RepID=UPI00234CB90B|nr:male-specific lethal 1-like 1 isoform X2 [Clarias gariepinus]